MEKSEQNTSQLVLRDTDFVNLMKRRIFDVLLIANPYDAFMLEEDGRVEEKIFDEYGKLGLRYPPRFHQVGTTAEAETALSQMDFDLIICMPAADNLDVFEVARRFKKQHTTIPVVVLTPFSVGIRRSMKQMDYSLFDYVFCWLGNTDLLLAIIKLIEDSMNLEHDIAAGVQIILLVEDSIRYYSSLLPHLFRFVLEQSLEFSTEALNARLETLRMRGRPKIVLARTYEEAWSLYTHYEDNILGIITDCSFPRNGTQDDQAGERLLHAIREKDEFAPLIMDSSESSAGALAKKYNAHFLDKNSKKIGIDLKRMLRSYFGFGDFVFNDPVTGNEVARIKNLKDLQDNIFALPKESLMEQITKNNVSRWLCSRALFPLSEFLKGITWRSLKDVDAHRQIIYDAIVCYRRMKNQGVVADFHRERFDRFSNFARIGEGSLGGKGRGLAFLDYIIKKHPELNKEYGVEVMIPKTVVLCTDIFDTFMETGELFPIGLSDDTDENILSRFIASPLPLDVVENLRALLRVIESPIAVRSSSLLEDAHYQPFAGIYSTYMIPSMTNENKRLSLVERAIKAVYASVFYKDSKAYMTATSNVIDQEKMAVILQEVAGNPHDSGFYPEVSGVARSMNYYPIGDEEAEEGVADIALGLGKYIVDGGRSLRVCPAHPDKVLQTSEMEMALRETQTQFYAIDTTEDIQIGINDELCLKKLNVRDAEQDGALRYIASTYDPQDMVIRDGLYDGGRKLITFCGILQQGVFPLPELIKKMLVLGRDGMKREIELEFAVKLRAEGTGVFYPLQIRPMVAMRENLNEDLTKISDDCVLLRSHNAIGHGIITDITDVVYVKTDQFNAANNTIIQGEIDRINKTYLQSGSGYVLIGPGRWGSSDPWLGIPVKWPNISAARIIVEAGLSNYLPDPSQGTHFFQNMTSFGVGYFTINAFLGEGVLREDILNSMEVVKETQHVRVVRFKKPIVAKVDGRHKEGVVLLPERFSEN